MKPKSVMQVHILLRWITGHHLRNKSIWQFAGTDMKVHSLLLDVVPVSASANAPLTSQVILERVDKHFVHSRQLFGPKK